jgi:hypothetical protein
MSSDKTTSGFLAFPDFLNSVRTADYRDFISRSGYDALNKAGFEQMKTHILKLYEGVEVSHSYADSDGVIFDCVVRRTQPSARQAGGVAQPPDLASPPHTGGGEGRARPVPGVPQPLQNQADKLSCPEGTIPMRRVTLEDVARLGTTERFLGKGGGLKQAPPNPRRSQ